MSEELVNIEVDGVPMKARKGAMIIEATDAADIYIPRFCYHEKLSVAANCRMCLVQVEKMAKPAPACATPVMEGMKIYTKSPAARDAQKSTMEFLLINHPLDCPICDQGGECELQDLAMGYGASVSRYTEGKRVVQDKNIGPLIQTDMTRCIHCTRCVRFGEEIAGLRELGATGRGEYMQIGTYVEKAVRSELSGNVIDLCPVGALTSKPFRYTARAWELRAKPSIAPHDCVGSNIEIHVKGQKVKRVVPRENESVNEVWISDRDRYSYEALNSPARLLAPMVKDHGQWREVDWDTAIRATAESLRTLLRESGPGHLAGLASPSSTVEELYLFQKLLRGLGVNNIDHRLRQGDFRDQERAPLYPSLGQSFADLEQQQAVLLIGSDVRREQPLINHRLRKAALRGAGLLVINPVDFDFNWPARERLVVAPGLMIAALAGVARALAEAAGDGDAVARLHDARVEEVHRRIAGQLKGAARSALLLGNIAAAHPDGSILRSLAQLVARLSGSTLGYLSDGANGAGAWLAGALPHRGPAGQHTADVGMDGLAALRKRIRAYILMGVDPALDTWDGYAAGIAMQRAGFVVGIGSFRSDLLDSHAHVLLPMAAFAETPGTYVNAQGDWQGFEAAVAPPGEARPAWRILRVLGDALGIPGFSYMQCSEVRDELRSMVADRGPENVADLPAGTLIYKAPPSGVERVTTVSMYSTDALARHAPALQAASGADVRVRVSPGHAASHGLTDGARVRVVQGEAKAEAILAVDARVPDTCVLIDAVGPLHMLGPSFGPIKVERA
ncbi:MAG: NADH-quinone oxidoreductase chain 3 [Gammaproteobacteria bacterium]|nr:NADH-quinone oxidoreductase chain 3 [Gammaproteobacteria bacterium]